MQNTNQALWPLPATVETAAVMVIRNSGDDSQQVSLRENAWIPEGLVLEKAVIYKSSELHEPLECLSEIWRVHINTVRHRDDAIEKFTLAIYPQKEEEIIKNYYVKLENIEGSLRIEHRLPEGVDLYIPFTDAVNSQVIDQEAGTFKRTA